MERAHIFNSWGGAHRTGTTEGICGLLPDSAAFTARTLPKTKSETGRRSRIRGPWPVRKNCTLTRNLGLRKDSPEWSRFPISGGMKELATKPTVYWIRKGCCDRVCLIRGLLPGGRTYKELRMRALAVRDGTAGHEPTGSRNHLSKLQPSRGSRERTIHFPCATVNRGVATKRDQFAVRSLLRLRLSLSQT